MRKKGFGAFLLALALTVTSINCFGLNASAEVGGTVTAKTASDNNPGGETPDQPGTDIPGGSASDNNPGGETPDQPGTDTPDQPGTDTPDQPGTVEKTPGEILADAMENGTASDAFEVLTSKVTMEDLEESMQSDPSFLGQVEELETRYSNEKGITVDTNVSDAAGVDSSQVKIVGAAFSAEGSDVQLSMDATPEENKVQLPASVQFQASVQLDIKLVSGGTELSALKMPVSITMPVPQGVGLQGLVIMHYHGDGFDYVNFSRNGDGTITLTVKNFSTFVFAQAAEGSDEPGTDEPGTDEPDTPGTSTPGDDDDNNGDSSTGGSSAGSDASLDDVVGMIRSAASKGTVTITKADGITSLSNDVMKALLKRSDVTLVMEYTYQGKDYRIVIPAGKAVDNDIPWYGPLYLANYYGNGSVAVAGAADYIVKAGDTLGAIARANGMTVAQIAAKNPQIKNVNLILVGQKITLK